MEYKFFLQCLGYVPESKSRHIISMSPFKSRQIRFLSSSFSFFFQRIRYHHTLFYSEHGVSDDMRSYPQCTQIFHFRRKKEKTLALAASGTWLSHPSYLLCWIEDQSSLYSTRWCKPLQITSLRWIFRAPADVIGDSEIPAWNWLQKPGFSRV